MRFNSIITLSVLYLPVSVLSNPALNQIPRQAQPAHSSQSSEWLPWERISRNDSALLVVDHQIGLYQLVRDFDAVIFKQNLLAHAEIGKLFNLPVVMTTSAQTGPNGPLVKEVLDMFPDAPNIQRNGEVNAWDNPEFREAVRRTGKKQLIIAGIVTDVCTEFLALSLRSEGFSVFANIEASGTGSSLVRDTANLRMQGAGVHLMSTFGVLCDLMRDWRNTNPGVREVVSYVNKYLPTYGILMRGHASAILQNGTVLPGAEKFI
ncbi:Isochorismatase hydrolase [Periconia macrospinosa]|uniref:Isochorismatase hydrolase n=1 Tax=Periconia macrospinosa TaxID=97972 RepID=A0A2V1DTG8_9PLEO|nr:Isochorismatase hydrolase [Periconia macrospinosa]